MSYPILYSYYCRSGDKVGIEVLSQYEFCKAYLCLSFREIKRHSRKLYALFEEFSDLFPDHPTEDNTFLIFMLDEYEEEYGYEKWRVLVVCTHFEHNCIEDMVNLVRFMCSMASTFREHPGQVLVNVLQGNGEFLILELMIADPRRSIPEWVRRLVLQEFDLKKIMEG